MRRTLAVAVAATLAAGLAPVQAQATTGADGYKRVAYFIQWGVYG